jgi:hypothetical protein
MLQTALESAAGPTVCPATRARTRQSRHLAGGAQASRLSASRGRSSLSQYTLSSVLRSAGLLSLNLRGRSFTVPANGCLATLLLRWLREGSTTVLNRIPQIAWGKPIPPSQGKSPFSLDGYLSWMSPKLGLLFRRLLLSIGYGERSQATGNWPTKRNRTDVSLLAQVNFPSLLTRIAAMGMLETPQ